MMIIADIQVQLLAEGRWRLDIYIVAILARCQSSSWLAPEVTEKVGRKRAEADPEVYLKISGIFIFYRCGAPRRDHRESGNLEDVAGAIGWSKCRVASRTWSGFPQKPALGSLVLVSRLIFQQHEWSCVKLLSGSFVWKLFNGDDCQPSGIGDSLTSWTLISQKSHEQLSTFCSHPNASK